MTKTNQALTEVTLTAEDVPAYCPHITMPVWSSHPKVYLDFSNHGEAKCPYCGTVYKLKDGEHVHAH